MSVRMWCHFVRLLTLPFLQDAAEKSAKKARVAAEPLPPATAKVNSPPILQGLISSCMLLARGLLLELISD